MQKPVALVFLFFLFSAIVNAQIHMVIKPEGFLFLEGTDSICFYQKQPKSKDGQYERCNYIHPLYGLDGSRITEDFPDDHLHHRGVFWAWHQILINGCQVSDGWELKNFKQDIQDVEFRRSGDKGILTIVSDWKSPLWRDGNQPYMKEEARITIFTRQGNYRRIDVDIKLKALTDRLSLGGSDDKKGYGGFSVRLRLPDDVWFESGKRRIEPTVEAIIAGQEMKIAGSFLKNGEKGGLIIRNMLSNPEPSSSWILRKKDSMQNAVYPGRTPVAIPFDQPLTLSYSMLVFKGELSETKIRRALKE